MDYPKPPEPFLELKIHNLDSTPPISALCAGYECGEWRSSQLAEHAMEWLPEFCLTANELKSITSSNALKMIRKAAQLVYQTDKYKNRGEFGELFLHIVLRQIYGSIPAISKIYFKDAVNTTVKGFDAVHIININDTFELWLGEVKFYNNAGQAIRDVIDEIKIHTTQDYLKNEKMLLLNKID
ncbi:TPA: HamA C-terminal domain-containing protein, partial [Haemophilus influenzae]